ncbi:MAG: hypothetical protein EXQ85_08700 [Alphaproteobacteria bacterium]|nr:hypothetical protein [Alphaproteobacteria bacterium]
MRNLIFVGLLAGCLALPIPALAQTAAPDANPTASLFGMSAEEAATIGAGVIVGAIVLHFVVPGDFAYLVGGVAGGYLAAWWYRHRNDEQVRAMLHPTVSADALRHAQPPVIAIRN